MKYGKSGKLSTSNLTAPDSLGPRGVIHSGTSSAPNNLLPPPPPLTAQVLTILHHSSRSHTDRNTGARRQITFDCTVPARLLVNSVIQTRSRQRGHVNGVIPNSHHVILYILLVYLFSFYIFYFFYYIFLV